MYTICQAYILCDGPGMPGKRCLITVQTAAAAAVLLCMLHDGCGAQHEAACAGDMLCLERVAFVLSCLNYA